MKDTVSSKKVIKDTNSHTKDSSKLKYKKRLQIQFAEEQEIKRIKIEQQKEERNFRTEKRAMAKAKQAEERAMAKTKQAEERAEQAENDLIVQRTQLAEKLRDFRANIRHLQKFIDSKKLTGKISRETNQLIENSYEVIKEVNDAFANYSHIYKELDNFIYDEYQLIAIDLINKYHNHNDKNSILYETRNNISNYKYEVFSNSIDEHKQILKKIEETNKQLSEELSSLTKNSPSPDQPLPQYQQNSQQEQAILSSPDHQREKFMVEQIQKVDREIRPHFQSQVQEFERQRHELQERISLFEPKVKSSGNEKAINDFNDIKQKFENANNDFDEQLTNYSIYHERILNTLKSEIQNYKKCNDFRYFKNLDIQSTIIDNYYIELINSYKNYINEQNKIMSNLNSINNILDSNI
jgi:hypothetical protein